VDRIIRICSLATVLTLACPLYAAEENGADKDLYWQAQRAALSGQSVKALKDYNKLLGKFPESGVAVDRLLDTAMVQGDFPSALRAARAQQLSGTANPALPLIFYVDAWRRKDWDEASKATAQLRDNNMFAFMAPALDSWASFGEAGKTTLSDATLQANNSLAYYADDQLIYIDLANRNFAQAKSRLSRFPGFGEDYARHLALSSTEYLGANGEAEFANALLEHLGLERQQFANNSNRIIAELAMAALFARLAKQLDEQGWKEQAFTFARLSQWMSNDSAYARMTLSEQLAKRDLTVQAIANLSGIDTQSPQWSWAVGEKAKLLPDTEALQLIQSARQKRPNLKALQLMEASHLVGEGKYKEASDIYKSLIKAADSNRTMENGRVTYRLLLGQTLEEKSDWPAAKAVMEEALAISDKSPQLLNSLGYGLLQRREDVKRGFELVSKAYALAPQSPAIADSLGWGHYLNGDNTRAIAILEKAVERAIGDVTINEHLGDVYWQAGRQSEARYAWRAASLQAKGKEAERISSKIDLGWTEATAAP
jgi:Flp pilus assembly protein TadD